MLLCLIVSFHCFTVGGAGLGGYVVKKRLRALGGAIKSFDRKNFDS